MPPGAAKWKDMGSQRAAQFAGAIAVLFLLCWSPRLHARAITNRPFVGITHITRWENYPRPVVMNLVLVDLTAPGIRFKVTRPSGSRDTIRQSTLQFLEKENVQVAVNCHFFLPFPSLDPDVNVTGLAAWRGRVYSGFEPQPIAPFYRDQSYAIVPYAPALNIGRGNRITIVHHDPANPDDRHAREPVRLWNAIAGSAQIVTAGWVSIPSYSNPPDDLNPLNGYSDLDSWYGRVRARTVIGLTADEKVLVLFTVDEAGGSFGMNMYEAAALLISDYDVRDALNMDGGGSTTLAMRDPVTRRGRVMNVSSDNPLGRAVGSNLGVSARRPGAAADLRR